jgi:hypothetical protein
MQWPFETWGTDAVLSGHDHNYERLEVNSLSYFVNGCGGRYLRSFSDTLSESRVMYCSSFGAQIVVTYKDSMVFCHININDSLIDRFVLLHNPVMKENNAFLSSEEPEIFPNPFSHSSTICFSLSHASDIQILAYNAIGELVDIIADRLLCPGSHSIQWKNNDLKSGIYYLTISNNRFCKNYKVLRII